MKKTVQALMALFFLPVTLFAQKQSLRKNGVRIYGNYSYLSAGKLSGMTLEIKPDHTFNYWTGGCIETYHANGKWTLEHDTLRLFSALLQDDIPVRIEEQVVDSIKGNITFSLIQNLDHEVMGAFLYFNGDTVSAYDPQLIMDFEMKTGSVDSIQVRFMNGAKSAWYKLRNKSANRLRVTVLVHDLLVYYLCLRDEKYLYKNDRLYVLPEVELTEPDMDGATVKRPLALEKQREANK